MSRLQVRAGILFLVQRSPHIERIGIASRLNELIKNLVIKSTAADRMIDWIDIAFFAFGADCGGKAAVRSMLTGLGVQDRLVSVAELAASIHRFDKCTVEIWDEEAGDLRENVINVPIWIDRIEPQANSPLCHALTVARQTLAGWIAENRTNYPPFVFILTDGSVDDGEPKRNVAELAQLGTVDGPPLLFIHHFPPEDEETQIRYPNSPSALPPHASRHLYDLSTTLPDPHDMARRIYAKRYSAWTGALPEHIIEHPWETGSKAYACNVWPNLSDLFGCQCSLYTDD